MAGKATKRSVGVVPAYHWTIIFPSERAKVHPTTPLSEMAGRVHGVKRGLGNYL